VFCCRFLGEVAIVEIVRVPDLGLLVIRDLGVAVEGRQGLRAGLGGEKVGWAADDVLMAAAATAGVLAARDRPERRPQPLLDRIPAAEIGDLDAILAVVVPDDVLEGGVVRALDEPGLDEGAVGGGLAERADGAGRLGTVDD
jgi:hypothetical protein